MFVENSLYTTGFSENVNFAWSTNITLCGDCDVVKLYHVVYYAVSHGGIPKQLNRC